MSGSASRSQLSRFVKRRLMLLMLKLAIFIGVSRRACIGLTAIARCRRRKGERLATASPYCLSLSPQPPAPPPALT